MLTVTIYHMVLCVVLSLDDTFNSFISWLIISTYYIWSQSLINDLKTSVLEVDNRVLKTKSWNHLRRACQQFGFWIRCLKSMCYHFPLRPYTTQWSSTDIIFILYYTVVPCWVYYFPLLSLSYLLSWESSW